MIEFDRGRLQAMFTDYWGDPGGEWSAWAKRLVDMDYDLAAKALTAVWSEQETRRRPVWKRFAAEYARLRDVQAAEARRRAAQTEQPTQEPGVDFWGFCELVAPRPGSGAVALAPRSLDYLERLKKTWPKGEPVTANQILEGIDTESVPF